MAVYDPTLICNMALDRCKIGQRIGDIEDTNHRAQACKQWYAICRDRVLAAFTWPFTLEQVVLGLVMLNPTPEWGAAYRRPNNCVVARRIVSGTRPEASPIPFQLSQDATGQLILTNEIDAILEMNATFADPGEWPDIFASAVSAQLASEIARPLRAAAGVADEMLGLFDRELLRAQGVANQERQLAPPPVSSYISARGGRRNWPDGRRG